MTATPLQKEYPRHNPAEESLEEAKPVEMPAVDPEFTARLQEGPAEEGGRIDTTISEPPEGGRLSDKEIIAIERDLTKWQQENKPEGFENVGMWKKPPADSELGQRVARMQAQNKADRAAMREQNRPAREAAQRAKEAKAEWKRRNPNNKPDAPPEPTGIDHVRILNGPDATQALDLDMTGKPRTQSAWSKVKGFFGG
jgi:hypothetical protein